MKGTEQHQKQNREKKQRIEHFRRPGPDFRAAIGHADTSRQHHNHKNSFFLPRQDKSLSYTSKGIQKIHQIPEGIEKKENEKNFYCFFSHFLLRVSFKVPAAVSSYPLHQSPVGEHQQKNDEQAADKFPAGQPFRKSRKKQGSFSEKIQRQKAAKLSRRNLSIF